MFDLFLYRVPLTYSMTLALAVHGHFLFFRLLKNPVDVTNIFILH